MTSEHVTAEKSLSDASCATRFVRGVYSETVRCWISLTPDPAGPMVTLRVSVLGLLARRLLHPYPIAERLRSSTEHSAGAFEFCSSLINLAVASGPGHRVGSRADGSASSR